MCHCMCVFLEGNPELLSASQKEPCAPDRSTDVQVREWAFLAQRVTGRLCSLS